MEDCVSSLIEAGHRFGDIQEYTLPQFLLLLNAAARRKAERRLEFITDLSAVVGGIFGEGDAIKKHIDSLTTTVTEERSNGGKKRT